MQNKYPRRDFIKKTAQTLLGFKGLNISSKYFIRWVQASPLNNLSPSVISVAKKGPPGKLVRDAINALGGIKKFINQGEEVVLKPNISWDRTPELAANTNPMVLREVILLCLEANAKKIKIIDRPCNDPERSYVSSGAFKVVEEINDSKVELLQMDPRKFKIINIPGATHLKKWHFYEDFLNADKIISIPIAKHHSSTEITMSFKNTMGMVGGQRSLLHENIHHNLVDLNRVLIPSLIILDAIRIITRNGPQGGDIKDTKITNTVIAGTDRVSIDAYGATLFNKKGTDLDYLRYAYEAGMGEIDLGKVEIRKL
ncbi:MAG: DUF362 domain-containing protein [Candidatus Firestonebacteria bacterium]|nr:DUF362 domain-containing protein [Candidatus Firestonebacteria bacterium]